METAERTVRFCDFATRQRGGFSMSQERLYKRVRPTGLMSSKAKIIVAPKSPPVDCKLVDYSAGGACLELAPMVTLPARFELLYGSVRKKCRMVWRRGMRMGVTF